MMPQTQKIKITENMTLLVLQNLTTRIDATRLDNAPISTMAK